MVYTNRLPLYRIVVWKLQKTRGFIDEKKKRAGLKKN
jgi:hypothetical protein